MSELTDAQLTRLRHQMEFYFSDVNLSRDAFLKDRVAEDKQGFVPLSVFFLFKKVKDLVGASTDAQILVKALSGSESLIVDSERLAVRRATPLPAHVPGDNETLYAKPIPVDADLDELKAFFTQFGQVEAVWRRHQQSAAGDSQTKPSVFVVFRNADSVAAACTAAPTFRDVKLEVLPKVEYLRRKGIDATHGKPGAAAAASSSIPKSPPMPADASVRISDVGTIENLGAVRGLWGPDLLKYIRYVTIEDSKEAAVVIFMDSETRTRMEADIAEKGTTLNGRVPKVTRLTAEEDKAATVAAEKEIEDRANAKREAGGRGGRGGGRGGRGGSRGGRGGGRGGKRPRD